MKKIFGIIILIFLSFGIQNCQNTKSIVSEFQKINLGNNLFTVVNELNIKTEDLQSIQEPQLIVHGFSFSENNDIGYLIIERTPISPENIGENSKIYDQIKDKKIIGVAWRKGNTKGYKGIKPPRWK
jgi:hypothetical protein